MQHDIYLRLWHLKSGDVFFFFLLLPPPFHVLTSIPLVEKEEGEGETHTKFDVA